ncbi:MAG: hypothetical protein WC677_02685 [Clostridia bacterium]|jgi:hypothetical protein
MFNYLANKLLSDGDYIHLITENGDFGFEWRRNYSGLMAQPSRTGKNKGVIKKSSQGLFDIFILTGSLFENSGVTHRDLIENLISQTSLQNCLLIWRGSDPLDIANSTNEAEMLTTLMLMFFEQEINWGKERWQKYTYFAPRERTPNRLRPRDMLMGYISQAYQLGVNNIAYWMTSRPTTATFIAPDRSNYGYEDYPFEYKQFFLELEDDEFATALMTGNTVRAFRDASDSFSNNPHYIGG